ncbi:exo-beta-N-acetylmuramidase NamZ domain-containing protein [Thermodesulfobacteriota bacterium]
MISLGIEQLLSSPPQWLSGSRLGLLCNQASTSGKLHHSRDLINNTFPGQLTCLFSPQHGFFSEKQDNMIESGHTLDSVTGLPLYSLYSKQRRPNKEMFELFDVLIIDLFDVGTRVYTFLYTMAYCLEAAAEYGKKVLVLDRPNPVGGKLVEGNIIQQDCFSFVGLYPIPMRHGLTFGELALLINNHFGIGADLEVIHMQGWQREMLYTETGLPWVFPSPNMVSPATSLVYPGQVIWEGTNISEGRGTCLPFELFGAPFFNCNEILDKIQENIDLNGCFLRPLMFEPTSNKWDGLACHGFQIHVTDPAVFRPYRTSLALLQAVMLLYPETFQYKEPPYEYEYERLPMDLILGDRNVRKALEQDESIKKIEESWQDDLDDFDKLRQEVFLYN